MKIYTKTGDAGKTSLLFGQRVSKHELKVEAYGTVDETNSAIGLALSCLPSNPTLSEVRSELQTVQQVLFNIGSELATPAGRKTSWEATEAHVQALETAIDSLVERIPPLTCFILPGGSQPGATLHLARTVARRSERLAVAVASVEELNPCVIAYLNRLSDYLFVCARFVNQVLGEPEPAGPVPQGLKGNARQAAEDAPGV